MSVEKEFFGMVIEEDYSLSHLNFSGFIKNKLAAHSKVTVPLQCWSYVYAN
jgi:hypothetical protein